KRFRADGVSRMGRRRRPRNRGKTGRRKAGEKERDETKSRGARARGRCRDSRCEGNVRRRRNGRPGTGRRNEAEKAWVVWPKKEGVNSKSPMTESRPPGRFDHSNFGFWL